jgi:O-acetylhomoserine (thiol)-lyase
MNGFLFIQGLETLALRMERHSANAEKVANFLVDHPDITYVNYPTLPSHPSHELVKKYLPKGCSSLLSFGVKGGYEVGKKLVDEVRLASHLANLGDTKTLIIHPASTTHEQLRPEEKIAAGAPDELIRMSIGIEDAEDIIADLRQALERAQTDS